MLTGSELEKYLELKHRYHNLHLYNKFSPIYHHTGKVGKLYRFVDFRPYISATRFALASNRARQRYKGAVVRRGRNYP